ELGFSQPNSDYNSDESLGSSYLQMNIQGYRVSTFLGFMSALFAPSNKDRSKIQLDILPQAQVVKLLFDDSKQYIKGIEFVDLQTNSRHTVLIKDVTTGEVIVCAGTVASPQLLLLSGLFTPPSPLFYKVNLHQTILNHSSIACWNRKGIGDSQELQSLNIPVVHHVPGVGKNLQDHMILGLRYKLKDPSITKHKVLNTNNVNTWDNFVNYIWKGHGFFNTSGLLFVHIHLFFFFFFSSFPFSPLSPPPL
ncbi:hypothetical protein RFI_17892, partial [Reticulomyxa filosa]